MSVSAILKGDLAEVWLWGLNLIFLKKTIGIKLKILENSSTKLKIEWNHRD